MKERGMAMATVVNKTVVTDRNPYNLYSYPQSGSSGGVLKLWVVEMSAAGLCCSCCGDIIVNRCVYSWLISVVVTYCLLVTGQGCGFLYSVKECDAVYSGMLVSTFLWNLLYSFTSSVQKI